MAAALPTDKQRKGSLAALPDRISHALETTERNFDAWLVERERACAREWMTRHWPEAAVPLPDAKYGWPDIFKHKGHRAMLVTGYPEDRRARVELSTAFYEWESVTVPDEPHTPSLWLSVLRLIDRRNLVILVVLAVVKAQVALISLLQRRFGFDKLNFLLGGNNAKRPQILYLVAPGPQTRTLAPRDAVEAAARGLTVVFDATGIICSGSFEGLRTQITRRAIKDLCAWALAAAEHATQRDEPQGAA